jgi:hypothetical protein
MRKSWPQFVIGIGVLPGLFGIAFAVCGAIVFGLAVFLVGAAAFLIGGVAAIARFAIRRRLVPHFALGLAALILLGFSLNKYCFSMAYVRRAHEDPQQLWMHALKPFGGRPYYVGTEGEFSYFRAGPVFPERFKAVTSKIRLPRTFPLGTQKPYPVTQDMVYYREA